MAENHFKNLEMDPIGKRLTIQFPGAFDLFQREKTLSLHITSSIVKDNLFAAMNCFAINCLKATVFFSIEVVQTLNKYYHKNIKGLVCSKTYSQ